MYQPMRFRQNLSAAMRVAERRLRKLLPVLQELPERVSMWVWRPLVLGRKRQFAHDWATRYFAAAALLQVGRSLWCAKAWLQSYGGLMTKKFNFDRDRKAWNNSLSGRICTEFIILTPLTRDDMRVRRVSRGHDQLSSYKFCLRVFVYPPAKSSFYRQST